jgi:hypothetical protein
MPNLLIWVDTVVAKPFSNTIKFLYHYLCRIGCVVVVNLDLERIYSDLAAGSSSLDSLLPVGILKYAIAIIVSNSPFSSWREGEIRID